MIFKAINGLGPFTWHEEGRGFEMFPSVNWWEWEWQFRCERYSQQPETLFFRLTELMLGQ